MLASLLLKFALHQEIQSIVLGCACVSIVLIGFVSGISFKLLSKDDYVMVLIDIHLCIIVFANPALAYFFIELHNPLILTVSYIGLIFVLL
jgi:hypothetical protein